MGKYGGREAQTPNVFFRKEDDPTNGDIPWHHLNPTQVTALISGMSAATAALGNQTTLAQILSTLQAQADIATSLWTDNSGAYFVRRDIIDQDSGTVTVTFTNPTGTAATPGAELRPVANEESLQTQEVQFVGAVAGSGYSVGDIIQRLVVFDQNTNPPSVVSTLWLNVTTGAVISAPTMANLKQTSTITAIGDTTDASATTDTGNFSLVSLEKRGLEKFTQALTQIGAVDETAYDGSGSKGLRGVMAGVYNALTAPATDLPWFAVDPSSRTRTVFSVSGADTDAILTADTAGLRHVVTGGFIEFLGTGTVTFENDPTDVSFGVVAGEKWVLDDRPSGHFVTAANTAFSIAKTPDIGVRGIIYSKKV